MLVERDFGCCERAKSLDIFAFLFEVAPIEAAEDAGEILGAISRPLRSRPVREAGS